MGVKRHRFLCNGAPRSCFRKKAGQPPPQILDYRTDNRVRLALPDFVRTVFHIPARLLDLLEIAAYVFAADRLVDRGNIDAVEFSSWSRDFEFAIKVRDAAFWESEATKILLAEALSFISGDRSFQFTFLPGHSTDPSGLFDKEDFIYDPGKPHHVMLFSGGVDSLTGALERLATTGDILCLVSHRSSLPSTARTQDRLVEALSSRNPKRVLHYRCGSHLTGARAVSEAQRTRSFLYGSIAFALARALNQDALHFYENGVTSLNLQRRQDLLNARASRTTHPRGLYLLQQLFEHINGKPFSVENPYKWDTKADVLSRLIARNGSDLLTSSVSCSRTFRAHGDHTHCGACFQCIDRRLAIYASGLASTDNEQLYELDLTKQPLTGGEVRTAVVDYLRAAIRFTKMGSDGLVVEHAAELSQLLTPGTSDKGVVEAVCKLMRRFGEQTISALKNLQREWDDLGSAQVKDSLLQLVAEREYLREDAERLARRIGQRMRLAIPKMFRRNRPKDENDFNDKVNGLLEHDREDYRREFPATVFALARVVPDHELRSAQLLVEAKFVRSSTTPSKVSDAIAADQMKYPQGAFLVFLVYDPDRKIFDDHVFSQDLESIRQRVAVLIIR